MCMCVHAYMYVQVAIRARRGYQIPCCEPCKVASALNPPNHLSNPDITLFNFCPVPARKKGQIHNPHSDYIWSITAMTSKEQKKITHIWSTLCNSETKVDNRHKVTGLISYFYLLGLTIPIIISKHSKIQYASSHKALSLRLKKKKPVSISYY